ncbi:MAG: ABC transporter permease [Anaerolineales bacterium]|nr:ABC transporter permease [Anaerolineales bacterium]
MTEFFNIFDATLLNSTFRFVTPILLAALGGLICERVGVFNIALEGLMLTGAFTAVVGSYYAGSAVGGVLTAVVAGIALAAIFAYFAVTLRGDMIVLGIALNLLASGLTVFLLRTIFGVKGAFQDPRLQGLGKIDIPGLEVLPILGPLLSGHSWVIYLSWLLVAAMQLLLFHHALGLRMRGVGEHPEAAATLGVSVTGLRYLAVLLSGALCGLAGAQLSLGNVTLFVENMSAGRGWIAVVAVMFGQAHPLGVLAASLLFGLADSIGFRLQGLQMPSQFTGMVPYVVTLVSLFIIETQRRRKAVRS